MNLLNDHFTQQFPNANITYTDHIRIHVQLPEATSHQGLIVCYLHGNNGQLDVYIWQNNSFILLKPINTNDPDLFNKATRYINDDKFRTAMHQKLNWYPPATSSGRSDFV